METMIQPKITGYRQLNEAEAALMNEIKAHAEETRAHWSTACSSTSTRACASRCPRPRAAQPGHQPDALGRAGGRPSLQTGYGMLVRKAVAQPSTF